MYMKARKGNNLTIKLIKKGGVIMLRKLLLTDEEKENLSDIQISFLLKLRITKHIFTMVVTIVMGMDLGLKLANR
jgi:hypothetical protein